MPYINKEKRDLFNEDALLQSAANASCSGDLNFLLTTLCIGYATSRDLNYQVINDIMGALTGCQAEFYRRVAVPYERKKIDENGDVYPSDISSDENDWRCP